LFGGTDGALTGASPRATVSDTLSRLPDSKSLRPAPAPFGLRAARVTIGGEEVVIFSVPLARPALPHCLSAAEGEVAVALVEGLSNAEIAAARRTSTRTVANQVASLFRKLDVRSRSEAVAALGRLQRS
jgi:DNA-binding NarL/FixJ family response regulator